MKQQVWRLTAAVMSAGFGLGSLIHPMASAEGLSSDRVEQSANRNGDLVCGPRCVLFLLSHYGIDKAAELHDLVLEIQWPEIERGASLASLSDALRERDLHTAALKVPRRSHLLLESPAIVHLDTEDGIGHYAVCLPSKNGSTVRLWDGLSGEVELSRKSFANRWSGNVLLTSTDPLLDPKSIVQEPIHPITVLAVVALVVGFLAGTIKWWRRTSQDDLPRESAYSN
jgi:ABC-type bacteriocin/lantibiotic exporter with double-glycine peptidase domain